HVRPHHVPYAPEVYQQAPCELVSHAWKASDHKGLPVAVAPEPGLVLDSDLAAVSAAAACPPGQGVQYVYRCLERGRWKDREPRVYLQAEHGSPECPRVPLDDGFELYAPFEHEQRSRIGVPQSSRLLEEPPVKDRFGKIMDSLPLHGGIGGDDV